MGDKWDISVSSCGPRTQSGRQGGDKGETSVNPCGPRNPEWETRVGDKCGREVRDKWETCGRQV